MSEVYISVEADNLSKNKFFVPDYSQEIKSNNPTRSFRGTVRSYSRLMNGYRDSAVNVHKSNDWSGFAILKSDWERVND